MVVWFRSWCPAAAIACGLAVAGCGSDDGGGSGEAACTTLCEWDATCHPSDGPAPAPLGVAPDPIGGGGTGGSDDCVSGCVADYRDFPCLHSTLPACASCLEANGCESETCIEACDAMDACIPAVPLDPAPSRSAT